MRYALFVMTLVSMATIFSCKKRSDNDTVHPIDSVLYVNYQPMKPGNYWIYQNYRLDSANGAAHAIGTFDSCFVEKDTVINGKTYHKYFEPELFSDTARPTYLITFLRDSLSYIVDVYGRVHFSSTNFTDTFYRSMLYPSAGSADTIRIVEYMGAANLPIVVNAGSFIASKFVSAFIQPSSSPFGMVRTYDTWYSIGVGIVRKTTGFYMASPEVYERRLERYRLQ